MLLLKITLLRHVIIKDGLILFDQINSCIIDLLLQWKTVCSGKTLTRTALGSIYDLLVILYRVPVVRCELGARRTGHLVRLCGIGVGIHLIDLLWL